MKFRSDINGLRAIAVAAVVLYHFSVPHFGGGFIGVDVFFVISGFLMTDIIFRGIDKGSFSVLTFYRYRARRIVPALAAMCFMVLAIGWFVLLPSEFRALGKQAAASIGFFSNISFWREAGYFDVRSLDKWLLHTWSLSVEWQFYLLYPLVLVALRNWLSAAWLRRWIMIGTVISLATCIYLSAPTRWPSAAFYLLPTRSWEMLFGALAYLYPIRAPERTRAAMEWAGLGLIAFALLSFNAGVSWPGWLTLLPVAGTALIIAAARSTSWATSNAAAQFIGKISYSVYLWHWPIVVAENYYEKATQPVWIAGGILASFVLGYLSWKFVELRTQGKAAPSHAFLPSVPLPVTLAFALLVFIGGGAIYYRQGVPERFDHSVFVADEETYDTNPHRSVCHMLMDPCDVYKTQLASRAVILGDSHADALAEAVNAAVPNGKRGDVILIAVQGCPTVDGVRRDNGECFEANRKYIRLLGKQSSRSPPVIIVNHWSEYMSGESASKLSFSDTNQPGYKGEPYSVDQYRRHFLSTMCGLAKTRPVYLVQPVPEFDVNVPNTLAREKLADPGAPDLTLDMAEYYKRNARVLKLLREARDQCGVQLLDPTPYLCPEGKCLGSYQGRPLYSDRHHMSEYGNRFLVPMFKQVFASSQ
ncbi:acyltransferase family protein [Paraburkholderia sp. DD10]|uniref:Peptidoglycan/LPS O-acetylase OafA/YrhL, contains acyltransferase and SGNH-hydrolase domains n=2 Tax=Burkholderiaceae TaxID=119060 RepID=A0A1M6UYS8_9BURK|nr:MULTISPECIES: acyltransferase family protein [Paraburkholderia]AXE91458.1 acyltransferase [Paraburkholderia terricola]SDO92633.1 Peptidoglycan/LPS O-acetylase OafA/YrhL, contains acyltransferase and SGNH-hydrolase domains [Paraburkholderia sediminicola]SHK74368.1 Peptidoglycan/LPS O-acetylase OafA/YrhL, contains acyltransferase and SGNH-hydrolase domains [Paraburkholderia terricola]